MSLTAQKAPVQARPHTTQLPRRISMPDIKFAPMIRIVFVPEEQTLPKLLYL